MSSILGGNGNGSIILYYSVKRKNGGRKKSTVGVQVSAEENASRLNVIGEDRGNMGRNLVTIIGRMVRSQEVGSVY